MRNQQGEFLLIFFFWSQDELKMKWGLQCMHHITGVGHCCAGAGKGVSHTSQKYSECWIKDLKVMWKTYREESRHAVMYSLTMLFLMFISKWNTVWAPVATR